MPETAVLETPPATPPASPPATPPASPPPTPPASPSSWRDGLSETIRGEASLANFKTLDDLATGYINTKKSLSAKTDGLVKVPGENATPEEHAAWRRATGVPEVAEQYTLAIAEDLQKVMPEASLVPWKGVFHKLGVPQAMAQSLVSSFAEIMQFQMQEVSKQYSAERDKLRNEWGPETYRRREILADRAIQELVPEDVMPFLEKPGIAGHPFFLRLFARLGEEMAETGQIESAIVGMPGRDQRLARFNEITADALWIQGRHPNQAALTAERTKLLQELNPTPIK